MGMPVTVDVRDPGADPAALEEAFGDMHRVDELFSPFRADSEVSRIDRGELRSEDANPEVRAGLELCERYRRATGGWFSAWIRGRVAIRHPSRSLARTTRTTRSRRRHGSAGDGPARPGPRGGAARVRGVRHLPRPDRELDVRVRSPV